MNNIPVALREEMATDPFYERCCVTGIPATQEKVEWHHAMIFGSKQVQEKFAILPILSRIHAKEKNKDVRKVLDWIMLNRATDKQLKKYSKTISYTKRKEYLNELLHGPWIEGKRYFQVTDKGYILQRRSGQQNRAIHLFFEMLAKSLNDAGLDQRKVLKPSIAIPWTKIAIKEQLWRPIQQAMYSKKSTKDLLKQEEIDSIHETLMRHLGEKFHVEYINFPSYQSGYMESAPLKKDPVRYR